ncbi:c-type cytochrome [Pelagibaculum spongiae]|uniref:Cytochrome c domain-containing protein n=1 Tax=Pelagibaculum spongiae TaxID=2080658 RepID=A0A2V1GWS7_9GAMM|nr:cytochrome c5 family protein [Pelagibaculum spongiae]PVZ70460.1 hypothetical protein DC094_07700 [Pelagibaculum spongiae]
MKARLLYILAGSLAISTAAFADNYRDMSEEAINARIKPVGEVYIAGESEPAAPVVAAPAAARSGDAVYNASCFACHGTGVAGAPKLGDVAAWAPRIEKGLETLTTNAINGINAMPPRGTCADCSDDEILAAIEHMVSQSQ